MARLAVILALLLSLTGIAQAEERSSLLPAVPQASGEPHPEGSEFWRKHHMELMRHGRDMTVRDGVRPIEASLKGCFDCHAVKDDHGQYVTVKSETHFCRVCHDYAAVKVDCFMCHRSTPDGVDEHAIEGEGHAGLMTTPEGEAGQAALAGYLDRLTRPARRAMTTTAEAEQ
jgi:hypothetical protein